MKLREKLLLKITEDTGITISFNETLFRPNLSDQHKTAGRFVWYFLIDGICYGSCEKMGDLIKSPKIKSSQHHSSFVEFFSS